MAKRRTGPTFIGRSRQVASEQKAIWHNVTGAGRSHVIRRFFDVNQDDETAFATALEGLVESRLKKQGA